MIGKTIAITLMGIFLAAAPALAFGGGGIGVGAPMSTLIPSPPRNVTAVAGDGTATVSFLPSKISYSPVTLYTVTAYPGRIMAQGAKSPIVVAGLSHGVTYTFTVRATSVIGTGLSSEPSAPVTTR
ncbi:MAG: fibronectin type III domain-containing protein [Syntrophobacteraceae bacterium]